MGQAPKSGRLGALLVVAILILIFAGVFLYPYLKDSDADGIADANDAFPADPSETRDSDHDGIGDNGDFYDNGDGAALVRVTYLEHLDTAPCGSIPGACDTYFEFRVIWGPGVNQRCEGDSDLYEDTNPLVDPPTASIECNIPDGWPTLTVWVFTWDSTDRDFALDYTSDEQPGTYFLAVPVSFPFDQEFSFTGNGDMGKRASLVWSIEATRA